MSIEAYSTSLHKFTLNHRKIVVIFTFEFSSANIDKPEYKNIDGWRGVVGLVVVALVLKAYHADRIEVKKWLYNDDFIKLQNLTLLRKE